MIVARNLSKCFGKVVAVDSIDFRIDAGRVVGFLGSNGAGKTTTIRMIAGFLTPSQGHVQVDGIDVAERPRDVRRRIGYLPETTPLYGEMGVNAFLAFRGRLFGLGGRRLRDAVGAAVERCGLADVRNRPIRHLSKGYRQRVGLAAAILHTPPVLILDEPTVGLDPAQIREVRGLIRELAGRHTILLSTHILPEAELCCDEVIMIARGRVQAQGTIDELRARAAGSARYVVETDAADAQKILAAVAGVARVERRAAGEGWTRLTVVPERGAADLRAALGRALAARGGVVRELGRETMTLEEMFLDMVAAGGPAREAVG